MSDDSFLDKHSKDLTWIDSEKGNRVFAIGGGGGGGTMCHSPLVYAAQKKPGLDRIKATVRIDTVNGDGEREKRERIEKERAARKNRR